jgi:Pyridine nucleotide-disulphide oxidoreductase, dimerisation domain
VLVEEDTDRILGAHILGSDAGEVINLFALAIRSGMRATDLQQETDTEQRRSSIRSRKKTPRESRFNLQPSTVTDGYFMITVLSASMVTDLVTGEPFKGTTFTS